MGCMSFTLDEIFERRGPWPEWWWMLPQTSGIFGHQFIEQAVAEDSQVSGVKDHMVISGRVGPNMMVRARPCGLLRGADGRPAPTRGLCGGDSQPRTRAGSSWHAPPRRAAACHPNEAHVLCFLCMVPAHGCPDQRPVHLPGKALQREALLQTTRTCDVPVFPRHKESMGHRRHHRKL